MENETVKFRVQLTEKQVSAIERLAARSELSAAAWVRRWIDVGIEEDATWRTELVRGKGKAKA